MARQYWLMKSEPHVYSIDDLERDGSTCWEGVRNYQARNNMRNMSVGDRVLYYHSQADPPGVVGIAEVVKAAYPDPYQWDEGSKYFDARSTPEKPRWSTVDVGFVERFDGVVALSEIKETPALSEMVLVRNSRLSVQPVQPDEWESVVAMGRALAGD